eukprot:729049-Pelagomonas_calceolata.AAC.1
MKTERHNIAGRMITKAPSKSPLGAGLIYTDIGSNLKLAQHNLQTPAHASNRTTPSYPFHRSFSMRARSASGWRLQPARCYIDYTLQCQTHF